MNQTALITGGAGCIGSELARSLLAKGWKVKIVDNLSSGRMEHLDGLKVDFHLGHIRSKNALRWAFESGPIDRVWHLAAKTDIKFLGKYDFSADYEENLACTWALLDSMKEAGCKNLAFASSAAVYGDALVVSEDLPPAPISMYGATKLSCELLIRALALRAGFHAQIFRFSSIVSGKARTSGNMVVPDFIHKLKDNPRTLKIYGDGNQTKPSLHVSECVEAMQHVIERATDPVTVMNIGVADAISVTRTADLVCEAMGLRGVAYDYTGGAGGWPGDVPSFRMDISKLKAWGWEAKRTSEEAVRFAIAQLLESGE